MSGQLGSAGEIGTTLPQDVSDTIIELSTGLFNNVPCCLDC